jgi:4a-hydroxytetrahydrobiopterin dehydratase
VDKLAPEDIEDKLKEFGEWSLIGDGMQRTVSFENFVDAMGFVNKIAKLAEKHQHHPDILIRYSKVTLTLSTHDAGGLTDKDFAMAREIDRAAGG